MCTVELIHLSQLKSLFLAQRRLEKGVYSL